MDSETKLQRLRILIGEYDSEEQEDDMVLKANNSIKSTEIYVNLGVEHLRGKLNETINTLQSIGNEKGK